MWLQVLLAIFLPVISIFAYRWLKQHYWYWRNQDIPYIPSTSIFGNIKDLALHRNCPAIVFQNLYNDEKTKNEPIAGFQLFHKPALLLRDLDVIKKIMLKDFNYFPNRYAASDPHSDALGSYNLFFVKNPIWRQIRNHISPIFTSGKMKQFFHLVNDIGKNLDKYLQSLPIDENTNSVCRDVKEICALYTTDVIASVAYGIEANSINNPESEFRKNGRNIFDFTPWRAFEFFIFFFVPQLTSTFRTKVFSRESTEFLRSAFHYIVGEREKSKQVRNDLIDILIDIKNTTKIQVGNKQLDFDGDLLVSQAAIFFTAGYETTSATLSFGLYELAKDIEVQKRLRAEIKAVIEKNNGEITYDIIHEMEYLNMIIQEVLRMYPPIPFLDRQADFPKENKEGYSLEPISDFRIPDTMPIVIPIYAIQRDEKYYPEPDRFNPERFSAKNKHNIIPYTYLPFGNGNRVCIGERFGLMQLRIGFFNFLKNHYVTLSPNSSRTMKLNRKALIIQSESGIFCNIVRDPLIK